MGFRCIEEDEKPSGFSSFEELHEKVKNPNESNAKNILKIFYDLNIAEQEKHKMIGLIK